MSVERQRALESFFRDGTETVSRRTTARKSQGQGSSTELKERGIASAVYTSLQMSKCFPGKPYFLFDANAGSGWNDQANQPGSPLVMLEQVRRTGRDRVIAHFVELNYERFSSLEALVASELASWPGNKPICHLKNEDNRLALPEFAAEILRHDRAKYAMGTAVFDPNGDWDDIPVDELRRVARDFPRLDLIFNINVRYMRLAMSHKNAGRSDRWKEKFVPRITTLAHEFSRAHVLVQERHSIGSPWLLVVMRNTQTNGHRGVGLYPIGSPNGRAIIAKYSDEGRVADSNGVTPPAQAGLFPVLQKLSRVSPASVVSGRARARHDESQLGLPGMQGSPCD